MSKRSQMAVQGVRQMTEHEHFEAVVVGCGPGGAAAAAVLARNGVETLVLERGVEAGSKNVSGGVIYAEESAPYTIDDLFPEFRSSATERPVTRNYIHNVAGDRVKTVDITDLHHHDTAWADSVLRRAMDSWLEDRVHEMTSETGGGVLTDVRVNGLLWDDGEIVGVRTDELDPIRADVVIAADGVNSELARDAGLMDWEEPEEWFQGVKAVVDMPADVIEERFDIGPDEGEAHLFSGDLYDGVRGGGFLYTNRNSLSIGNVFHLDSIVEERAEVSALLDGLLTHPLLGRWLDEDYVELEYSAKLVPDSKKVALESPHHGRLLLVGDAAGQMQAQGPIIKGMNHAVTAGGLAAEAFIDARSRGNPTAPGKRYESKMRESGLMKKLKPSSYRLTRGVTESQAITSVASSVASSSIGRFALRSMEGVVEGMYNSPRLLAMLPDTRLPYTTLPTILGEELGEEITEDNAATPPDLDDRIGDLTYDVDEPHIQVTDESWDASGVAVAACPVSAEGFGGGCYREETVAENGDERRVVSLDTQPCVECGTCAVVAATDWEHPPGGKGVAYEQG
jgi:electron transfer flavoprotein-quinone oxidoreductase